jgi:hypothetical protein
VSDWAVIFLGVIAVATLTTAIIQVGMIVAIWRAANRLAGIAAQVERDLKPILDNVHAITLDAARASSLAAVQVERADRLFADVAERVDRTLNTLQAAAAGGAREGAALLAAFRAALGVVRDLREGRARARAEEEDALFI